MKIGIVGAGNVGACAAFALVQRRSASEIVLIDANPALTAAQCQDIRHSTPFAGACRIIDGRWSDLADSEVVILAAGVNQRPGETRIDLLGRNAAVFQDVIPRVLDYCRPVFLVATNPVDIMTSIAGRMAGDPGRVIGSGTILDTARFRTLLATHIGVSVQSIHAHVLGEHGDSEVLCWSDATIGGVPLARVADEFNRPISEADRRRIDADVRNAAYRIIEGKGATWFGIAAGLSRIVEAIGGNERALLTVSAAPAHGGSGPTLSLPRLVGAGGVLHTLTPALDSQEKRLLEASRNVLERVLAQIALPPTPAH